MNQELQQWWITGFVDGEGCFNVSFSQRAKMKFGYETRLSFSVSQHSRSRFVLEELQSFFAVGGIRFSKRDNCYKYEVRDLEDLSIIVQYFKKYSLRTAKKLDFGYFCSIYELVRSKHHLSKDGFCKVVRLAFLMNKAGIRKYTAKQLLNSIEAEDIV